MNASPLKLPVRDKAVPGESAGTLTGTRRLLGRLRGQWLFWASAGILFAVCATAALGPLLVQHDPGRQSLSNAFAPTERMTPILRTLAEWNPISSLVQGVRESWGNTSPVGADAALPLQHPVLATLLWTVGLTLLLAPLSIRAFQRRTSA